MEKIIKTSITVISLAKKGINIPFYNIIEMKEILLKELLEIIEPNSKNVIINFSKYKNLLFISAKYMELSIEEKQKFSVELLFNIFQYDFKNEEINTIINQELNVYEYYYSLN